MPLAQRGAELDVALHDLPAPEPRPLQPGSSRKLLVRERVVAAEPYGGAARRVVCGAKVRGSELKGTGASRLIPVEPDLHSWIRSQERILKKTKELI